MTEPERPAEKIPKPLGKTLRTMKAVLRTGYDANTKHLLNVYAFHLNDKRPDWDVWSGQDSLSRETGLSVDTIWRIQEFLLQEGVLVKRPPHPLTKKKKKFEKRKGGRPPRCFKIDIERLESLGYHDEKITQRSSRAKQRLQARKDKRVQRLLNDAHGDALRDDLARTIRAIRRRYPIVNGKRQTTDWYAEIERPIHEAVKAQVLRHPDLFVRSTRDHHAHWVRQAERIQKQREEDGQIPGDRAEPRRRTA
jgi:hypothetical protein